MLFSRSILSLLSLASFGAASPINSRVAIPSVGTWLWLTSQITDSSAVSSMLSFAQKNGVNSIYLQYNPGIATSSYQSFIAAASAKGISVQALEGEPEWALEETPQGLTDFLTWVETYQNGASSSQKFSAIHIDLTPYTLADWATNQTGVTANWQANVKQVVAKAKSLGIKAVGDVPFWLNIDNTADNSQTLSSWMMSEYDEIILTSYRTTSDAILSVADAVLTEADQAGRKVGLAVDTTNSDSNSFYGSDVSVMTAELIAVVEGVTHSSFDGLSVNDLIAWMAMKGAAVTSSSSSSSSTINTKSSTSSKATTSSSTSSLITPSPVLASTTSSSSSVTTSTQTGLVSLYYQCGGQNYNGPTKCVSGAVCQSQNAFYYQCVAAPSTSSSTTSSKVTSTSSTSTSTKATTTSSTTSTTSTKTTSTSTTTSPAAAATAAGTVPLYYQCGGINYTGATKCVAGAVCQSQNAFYYQCVAAPTTTSSSTKTTSTSSTKTTSTSTSTTSTKAAAASPAVAKYGQCGGVGYAGSTTCVAGASCVYMNAFYSQCL